MSRVVAAGLLVAVLAAGCSFSEYGPWLSPSGDRVPGSLVLEFPGLAQCDQEDVVFIRYLGRQYARDPLGQLGELRSLDGSRVLEYRLLDALPAEAVATGITHQGREIHVIEVEIEDYLFISREDGRAEQRPRAEVSCET
ncbi:MAG: hypothetical protein R6X29_04645 [Acidimicrobiia bacterium]